MELIKALILAITSHLPAPAVAGLEMLVGDQCAATLTTLKGNLPACTSLLMSKVVGLGIVVFASIIKLPQIGKMLASQSAEGISLSGYVFETLGYFITLSYSIHHGFPFSTYGEVLFLAIQNVIVTMLVCVYSHAGHLSTFYIAVGFAGVGVALFGPQEMVSLHQLAYLQAFAAIPLSLTSKIPQLLQNHRQQSTGQLSALTVFSYLAGSAARVFTTLAEIDDALTLFGTAAAFLLNLGLAVQMIMYWAPGPKASMGKKTQ
ncbi:uncharacterized protein V1510DRAFT_411600 [Dipodascopsis tothii]|uniref:uncharacterized protein n=1 Tax=Dipodascopsis tothii TaxID=44089 RepID=UPI0034CDDFFC